jgi:mannose-6-phosphate isomerase-like protein (cupin superfamily)
MFIRNVANLAAFSPAAMGKSTVAQGDYLFAGLNAFEPGQQHALHAHAGQDKLYFILEGSGTVQIGEESASLSAGDAAFAPSGVTHSIRNTGADRLVVMAILTRA